jgi:hypothetical protein
MDKLGRATFRVVAEFVFLGTDLTPKMAICSKIFQNVPKHSTTNAESGNHAQPAA